MCFDQQGKAFRTFPLSKLEIYLDLYIIQALIIDQVGTSCNNVFGCKLAGFNGLQQRFQHPL